MNLVMNKEINKLKSNDIDDQKENKIEKSTNILFGVTGSVAAIKTVHICKEILQQINGAVIKICITKSAKHFLNSYGMNELKNKMKIDIYSDETEWISWNKRGDSVVHIELRKWANIFLIAPLSANSLAKLSNGLSDNLLTSIFRAWNFDDKTVIVAPAMNTKMWNNPFTNKQLNTLKKLFKSKFIIISPISKKLECNDIGMGAMATPKHIVKITKNILQKQFKFRFINNQREKAILFAYDLFEKHKKESSETILKIIDYIICNPLCNVNQIDLINVISQNNNISSTYQRKILLLSSYLETVVPIFIPQSIAINISEYTMQSLKWTHIYNYLSNEIIKDLTIMTIIRIPSTITNRNHRIGVIIGTYPHAPNINVEVHRNGKLRYFWNNGEIDLYGASNLVDDKKHIIGFVRDTIKNEILIYLDGKLEIKINKCGTDMIINTKCFLFGRDYRNESMAFRGDILRINVWYEAMSLNDIINIGNEWNENEYILEKQKQFELNIKANNNIILNNFTVIALIKIPKEIG
eukprot:298395_1